MKPCLRCGQPCPNTRCWSCQRTHERTRRPSFAARGYTAEYRRNRARLLADHPVCAICGNAPATSADHVVPLSRGGTNDTTNLQPACLSCNSGKRDR